MGLTPGMLSDLVMLGGCHILKRRIITHGSYSDHMNTQMDLQLRILKVSWPGRSLFCRSACTTDLVFSIA